jgi:xylose isomerase
MDAFAVGLQAAQRLIDDGALSGFVKSRYASFDSAEGGRFERGELSLADLAALGSSYGSAGLTSGKQERLENILNRYLLPPPEGVL